jgi:DNA sulfur modification protein DndB
MGDWIYYITFVRFEQIAMRVRTAQDIHTSKSLNELLQRQLTVNAKRIAEYLTQQSQRFFNAVVIGTYGGNPQWKEVTLKDRDGKELELPEHLEGALGVLSLTGTELLFAVDGQHRIEGIKEALKKEETLGSEEVCAIFVKGVSATDRTEDPTGFERTRRLFSTLNRYAKPVGKRDVIALDEDDVVAIVTRRLIDEYSPFAGRIATSKGKNIPITDHTNFTTIVALYDLLDIVLRDRRNGWNDYKRWRPSDEEIDKYAKVATGYWNTLMRHFPELAAMKTAKNDEEFASKYRNQNGGHLLYRPVGILLLARAVRCLMDEGKTLNQAVSYTAKVPMDLKAKP